MSSLPVPPSSPTLSAVPPQPSAKDRCLACGQPVVHWYFRVNGAMHCTPCAQNARNSQPKDSRSAYTRALLLGSGAAFLGLLFYAAFGIVTGWVLGYLSFAVGYFVGKMMMVGSKGIGGRRYQVTAVLLTYAAVSMSAVPIAVVYQVKRNLAAQEQRAMSMAEEQRQLGEEFGNDASKPLPPRSPQSPAPQKGPDQPPDSSPEHAARPTNPARGPHPQMSPAAIIGSLIILGLGSPILELVNPIAGAIGLIILLVGIVIAWRITAAKAFEITGPFRS